MRVRTFNQRVSTSTVVLCAAPVLAQRLTKRFPRSLDGAPAVLPVGEMILRRQLEHWFESQQVRPRVIAEAEDTALLTDLAARGLGFVPVYSEVLDEITRAYRLRSIGIAKVSSRRQPNVCLKQMFHLTVSNNCLNLRL
jgi:LysR family transcriptional regulator, transcriptional activator of nhaA